MRFLSYLQQKTAIYILSITDYFNKHPNSKLKKEEIMIYTIETSALESDYRSFKTLELLADIFCLYCSAP